MTEPDEKQLKAEIDEIMQRVEIALQRIDDFDSKAEKDSPEQSAD